MTRKRTYLEAAHAMQTGVAVMQSRDSRETEPKSLRVGVNSAMVDTAAIVRLLVQKGIFTMREFDEVLTDQMNLEAESYEIRVRDALGGEKKITLG